jgi:hypothetical protein
MSLIAFSFEAAIVGSHGGFQAASGEKIGQGAGLFPDRREMV